MKKCLSTANLMSAGQVDKALEQVKQLGFAQVELSLSEFTASQTEQLNDLADRVEQAGIGISSIGNTEFDLFSLCSLDESMRERALTSYEQMIPWAGQREKFGDQEKPLVIIRAKSNQSDSNNNKETGRGVVTSYERSFNLLFEALERLTQVALKERVCLAFENPGAGLLLSPLEVRELIDQLNSPYVGICFNPHNAQILGDPLDWLKILGRRVLAVRTETGSINPEIVAELERINFQGILICEKT